MQLKFRQTKLRHISSAALTRCRRRVNSVLIVALLLRQDFVIPAGTVVQKRSSKHFTPTLFEASG
jgi:hypothetical protein